MATVNSGEGDTFSDEEGPLCQGDHSLGRLIYSKHALPELLVLDTGQKTHTRRARSFPAVLGGKEKLGRCTGQGCFLTELTSWRWGGGFEEGCEGGEPLFTRGQTLPWGCGLESK